MHPPKRKRPPPCHCDGWWFPHHRGCKWCVDYPKPYTEEDWKDHPAMRYYGHQQR